MESFINRHQDRIDGSLSCFDRVIFKGYLPLSQPGFMDHWLTKQGILLKNFSDYAKSQARRYVQWAKEEAEKCSRLYHYSQKSMDKEAEVQKILKDNPVDEGLICVLSQLETIHSYRIAKTEGRPQIYNCSRFGQVVYFYCQDPQLGLIHVRVETWYPFVIQVYVNGHSWLARQLDRRGLRYEMDDNALTWIEKPEQAQKIANGFTRLDWPKILTRLAHRFLPLLKNELKGLEYYWVADQVEFSTDILFKDDDTLESLFEHLLREATLSLSCEDVLRFLGRRLHGRNNQKIQISSKSRQPGARIKHWAANNWIKMYSKGTRVLRVELVINQPREFKILRWGKRKGKDVFGWYPMNKSVSNLWRYAEIGLAANSRYLEKMAAIENPEEAFSMIDQLCQPASRNKRRRRALNPLKSEEQDLFKAVMRGEHAIRGFRNKDIVKALGMKDDNNPKKRRKNSARVTRLLQLLHTHRLIDKVPRSRSWKVTMKGMKVMHAAVSIYHVHMPKGFNAA